MTCDNCKQYPYRWTKNYGKPTYGDFNFQPLSGVLNYWNGKYWMDSEIREDNGDIFEIVRLDIVPSPDDFELVMQ